MTFTGSMNTRIRWSDLRSLGNSKTIKSSYIWTFIVPVLAKLLAKIGPEVQLELLGYKWDFTFALPFSWEMFYFGAVAFAVASVIYRIGCPDLIRNYRNYEEYRASGNEDFFLLGRFLASEGIGKAWRGGGRSSLSSGTSCLS
jgi:hypothetical protein